MTLSPDELAARYEQPYRKRDRIEISPERFRKAIDRGDDGAWGAGALVVHGGKALLVRENEMWLLPGGRLESGELPRDGARRELEEETGLEIEIDSLVAIAEQTFVRSGSDDSYEFYFATFLGTPCGSFPREATRANDESIDSVRWWSEVPENTFDRDLVRRLFETYV